MFGGFRAVFGVCFSRQRGTLLGGALSALSPLLKGAAACCRVRRTTEFGYTAIRVACPLRDRICRFLERNRSCYLGFNGCNRPLPPCSPRF